MFKYLLNLNSTISKIKNKTTNYQTNFGGINIVYLYPNNNNYK